MVESGGYGGGKRGWQRKEGVVEGDGGGMEKRVWVQGGRTGSGGKEEG